MLVTCKKATRTMIIYTNEGNPLGLKLLLVARFAKKDVQVKIVSLNGKDSCCDRHNEVKTEG